MTDRHLAQINVARLKYPLDDPRVAGFVSNLGRVNGIADRSPGFVWRLMDEAGDATGVAVADDPRMIVNLSVWEDAAALEHFVWNTVHRQIYARRAEWFEAMAAMHVAMWWIGPGRTPTLAEALARLDHLNIHGPTDHAFGWESLPGATLWREARCA
jgi:hypothetical protein